MNARPGLTKEQELVLRQSTVVPRLSRRLAKRTTYLDEDELASVGNETEFHVAGRYDRTRGIPFEAFSYPPVHLHMRRAIVEERDIKTRELTGQFDAAYEFLTHAEDTADFLRDSDEDARRGLEEHCSGILGCLMTGWVAEATRAPTEDDLHEKADRERRRARLLDTLEQMGREGKILLLRYFEGLDWPAVGERVGLDERQARRIHNQAMPRLVALLNKKAR
jgi:RNA polymerase sigma factor (sigma-70 family)